MESTNEGAMSGHDLAEMARARASILAFLNLHFTTLPDAAFVEHVRGQEYTAALEALAADDSLPADMTTGAGLMLGFIRSTAGTEASRFSDVLGVDRTRLYRGVSPTYGPPPPYEAVWSKRVTNVASTLQEIAGIYRQSGMVVSPEAKERQDSIGVELDYLNQLALREAEAWEAGQTKQARGLLEAQTAFLVAHVGDWAPAFVEKALTKAETDFYRGHLTMLRGFLASERDRVQALLEDAGAAS
ncbi:MAG: molecular chaperone TorD family protein [Pseudomonadota bacterium]